MLKSHRDVSDGLKCREIQAGTRVTKVALFTKRFETQIGASGLWSLVFGFCDLAMLLSFLVLVQPIWAKQLDSHNVPLVCRKPVVGLKSVAPILEPMPCGPKLRCRAHA